MSPPTLSQSRRRRAEAACPVEMGDVVGDKYVVEKLIAAGGMGVVIQARHQVLGQTVAIKFLIPDAMEEQTISRFLREARNAARIQSERVVRVYDCGTLPSGVPYMVMEHLDGMELADVVRKRGALPVAETVDLVAAALEGVAEAHKLGIVHRDLKPTNLFLVGGAHRPYSVKVLDFGISKIQPGPDNPVDDELTGTSMLLGSPRYISPEQARSSSSVDIRADIWSVGVILYEVLDGKCPFAGDTIGEVLSKILLHTPEPLEQRRDDAPAGLALVVTRCLARDPAERFANVAELAHELAPFGSEHARLAAERISATLGLELPEPVEPSEPGAAVAEDDTDGSEAETQITPAPGMPQPSDTEMDDSAAKAWAEAERALGLAPQRQSVPEGSTPVAVDEPTPAGQRTEDAWAQTGQQAREGRRRIAAVVGIAALAAGALLAWRLLGPATPAAATAPTGSAATAAAPAGQPSPGAVQPSPPGHGTDTLAPPSTGVGADVPADAGAVAVSSATPVAPPKPSRPYRPPPRPRPTSPSSSILDQSD